MTRVGMMSSPPATPRKAAILPITRPAKTPVTVKNQLSIAGRNVVATGDRSRRSAIATNSMAMVRRSVPACSRVAIPAPTHAPTRLPARIFTTMNQLAATLSHGTASARNGSAEATTTKLRTLFKTTACNAGNPKARMRSGSRNSAPPNPISPPNEPTAAPQVKASMRRDFERGMKGSELNTLVVENTRPARTNPLIVYQNSESNPLCPRILSFLVPTWCQP